MTPAVPYQPSPEALAAALRAARGSWTDRMRRLLRGQRLTPARLEAAVVQCLGDAMARVYHDLYFLAEATPDQRAGPRVQAHAVRTLSTRVGSRLGLGDPQARALASVVVDDYARQAQDGPVQVGRTAAHLDGGLWTFQLVRGHAPPGRKTT